VKKYLVALLMGAFLAVALTSAVGCGETKTETTKKTETTEKKS